MAVFKWLYPGMRIKRWLLLALLGLVIAAAGVDLLAGGKIFSAIARSSQQLEQIFSSRGYLLFAGTLITLTGLAVMVVGLLKAFQSLAAALLPGQEGRVAEFIYEKRNLQRGPKIVVIGGGTGLSVLLRGLKKYTSNLTAIVTVADDGGSSGRLRGELGMLPPGDIRNCLVALADKEPLMEELLQYRFTNGELAGHCAGNLLLAALTNVTGSFDQAVRGLSKVLAVRGQVLPATLSNVTLCAELANGTIVQGESNIAHGNSKIERVFIKPQHCLPLTEALIAIQEADAIILGPGSLYTSIIPNLLVKGIPEALARTAATKIYVCNVMTQPGETDGYSSSDHLRAIIDHAGEFLDYVLLNTAPIPARLRARYHQDGAGPVLADPDKIEAMGVRAIGSNLIHKTNLVRHHPEELAHSLMRLVFSANGSPERVHFLADARKKDSANETHLNLKKL